MDKDILELDFRDYTLLENNVDSDTYAVRINTGPYKGVMYMYGEVMVYEENDEGHISWTYQLLDPMDFSDSDLKKDEGFHSKLGDILVQIIDEQLETGIAKIGRINTNTDTHTESSDS